jgi:hypothetical protein
MGRMPAMATVWPLICQPLVQLKTNMYFLMPCRSVRPSHDNDAFVTVVTRQRRQLVVPLPQQRSHSAATAATAPALRSMPASSSSSSSSSGSGSSSSSSGSGSSSSSGGSVQYTAGKPGYDTQERRFDQMPQHLREAATGLTTGLARSLNPLSLGRRAVIKQHLMSYGQGSSQPALQQEHIDVPLPSTADVCVRLVAIVSLQGPTTLLLYPRSNRYMEALAEAHDAAQSKGDSVAYMAAADKWLSAAMTFNGDSVMTAKRIVIPEDHMLLMYGINLHSGDSQNPTWGTALRAHFELQLDPLPEGMVDEQHADTTWTLDHLAVDLETSEFQKHFKAPETLAPDLGSLCPAKVPMWPQLEVGIVGCHEPRSDVRPAGMHAQGPTPNNLCLAPLALQAVTTAYNNFRGLGVSGGEGMPGSLALPDMPKVLSEVRTLMGGKPYEFHDVGAADGIMVLSSLASGASYAYGIELQGPIQRREVRLPGQQHVFEQCKAFLERSGHIPKGVAGVEYGIDVGKVDVSTGLPRAPGAPPSLPRAVFAFCDGFAPSDRQHMFEVVAKDPSVKLFICCPGRATGEEFKAAFPIQQALNKACPEPGVFLHVKDVKVRIYGSSAKEVKKLFFFYRITS